MIRVGTRAALWEAPADTLAATDDFAGRSITALVGDSRRTWALVDGRTVHETEQPGRWREHATIEGPAGTCLAVTPEGLLVGTEQAHVLRLIGSTRERVESFETADGRDAWYTPWGDPADVRSIAAGADGTLYVNVHVGGVVRSRDGGRTWTPTLDIESDVHQVLAHRQHPDVVLVAAAIGFGVSRDRGDSWQFLSGGLHARYLRAVAVSGETVLVSASMGPGGKRSALYRKALDGHDDFVRCADGLPAWFGDNIDTACLAAAGPLVVFGTEDGQVFRSRDGGQRWELLAKGLPPVTCITVE
ncbi:MAG: hypothetical protein HYR51_14840 [Candidatus Rokubacteria bacterium]|nr:hypothetical protein [Candidatus Rokubacteria bacterium]